MVIPPFSVILKTPTDSVLHFSATMTSADFCVFSNTLRCWLLLSERITQTSLGTTRFFLSICLPHLSLVIPCSYWASACYAVLPSRKTLYVISFRQTRVLPVVSLFPHPVSFRFPSRGHPYLRLYPSHCRADSGLLPVRNVRRQAHDKKRACANCLAHALFTLFIMTIRLFMTAA